MEGIRVSFVPKRSEDWEAWISLGCKDKVTYEKWVPHVCGICCLKMVGDTYGLTNRYSVYSLTMRCKELGGFEELQDGRIRGVFHGPLVKLAEEVGLAGRVEGRMSEIVIKDEMVKSHYVVLSVDLHRLTRSVYGSHLILIHEFDKISNSFIVHDCASVVDRRGKNIKIGAARLESISNHKGIILWKPESKDARRA